jgi:16S rRNA G966 N2-methylase RsmD
MRVVTGEAKGRKLKAPKTTGTRPIIDRVKTALFDILSTRVEDARFLDLFAGTGSVGIEALSRGAASATFIEMSHNVLKLVRENLKITGLAGRAETIHADAFKFLQNCQNEKGHPSLTPPQGTREGHPYHIRGGYPAAGGDPLRRPCPQYDIIYVAPPQYHEMAARALGILDTSPLVAESGLVIIQIHPKERAGVAAVPLTRLQLTDERKYGSTLLMFYEMKSEHSAHVDATAET